MARIRTEALRIPEVRPKFVEKTKETEASGWEKAAENFHTHNETQLADTTKNWTEETETKEGKK